MWFTSENVIKESPSKPGKNELNWAESNVCNYQCNFGS